MRILQLIDEIKHYNEPTRKSASEIHRVLGNNRLLFKEVIEKDYLNMAIQLFASLADSNPGTHNASEFKDEFERNYASLLYKLDRVF